MPAGVPAAAVARASAYGSLHGAARHQQARRHFWVGDKGGLGCEIGLSMGLPPCQGRICFSHGGWRGSQVKF